MIFDIISYLEKAWSGYRATEVRSRPTRLGKTSTSADENYAKMPEILAGVIITVNAWDSFIWYSYLLFYCRRPCRASKAHPPWRLQCLLLFLLPVTTWNPPSCSLQCFLSPHFSLTWSVLSVFEKCPCFSVSVACFWGFSKIPLFWCFWYFLASWSWLRRESWVFNFNSFLGATQG